MGVTKNITIAGRSLSEFNCSLVNPGIYDSPERDVTRVTIPGRSGDLLIDNGRFKNITVSYECIIESDDSQRDFEALTQWLKSLRGYQRIEEDFHPGEYRMGDFSAVISPTESDRKAVAFTLKPYCKSQRFLKSGDEPITIYPVWTVDGAASLFYAGGMALPVSSGSKLKLTQVNTTESAMFSGITLIAGTVNGNNVLDVQTAQIAANAVYLGDGKAEMDLTPYLTGYGDMEVLVQMTSIPNGISIQSGGKKVCFGNYVYIENPTPYEAKPLIVVNDEQISSLITTTYSTPLFHTGRASAFDYDVSWDNSTYTGDGIEDLYIDTDLQICYHVGSSGDKILANDKVEFTEGLGNPEYPMPVLYPGENFVRAIDHQLDGSTMIYNRKRSYTFYPRWYIV